MVLVKVNRDIVRKAREAYLIERSKALEPLGMNKKDEMHTAISRKVVRKNVHATIPKGNMGYVQYTVLDTVAVEPTYLAFL